MQELMTCIDKWKDEIRTPAFELNKKALLIAIAQNESSFGRNCTPRLEPAYDFGGFYFRKSPILRMQYKEFGDLVARSYGPFQIMYIVATELGFGFKRHPEELQDFDINTEFAVQYINHRALRNAETVQDVFDAYNSGRSHDANVPTTYIQRGMTHYLDACEIYPEG